MTDVVVVIGGGHGAAQFVVSARQEGYEGRLIIISDDLHLPYQKPPLSKSYLKNEHEKPQLLRAEAFYQDNNIEVCLNSRAKKLVPDEKKIILSDGSELFYDKLVLATGARPKRPAIKGIENNKVLVLRTLSDANLLRDKLQNAQSVIVLGGGFIGLEAAASLSKLGKKVTVIESASRVLGRAVAPIISNHVHQQLSHSGIKILLNETLSHVVEKSDDKITLSLSKGKEVVGDFLLLGIGVDVNDELAQAAGIACDNGIKVNSQMQTSITDIYAIGDCCNFSHWLAKRNVRLESVQNATDQAKNAAKSITGKAQDFKATPWFWSEIGESRLQMVGLSFDADDYILCTDSAENSFSVFHFVGEKLVSIDSINRPQDHMLGRKFYDQGFLPSKNDVKKGSAHLKEIFNQWRRDQKK
jgi:3-phenylpropionate/trans-cinnamate dioxygenase ferredoxin reductase subunit